MDETSNKTIIIKGPTAYADEGALENVSVVVKDGTIKEIYSGKQYVDESETEVIEYPPTHHLIPGMIDMHIHGSMGADVMDADFGALDTICNALPEEGTTAFLATTMSKENIHVEHALHSVKEYKFAKNIHGAEILGVHLEGPFLSPKRVGAQRLDQVIPPNLDLFKHWQSHCDGLIKLVTLAPEQPNGLKMVKYLKQNGIIASVGHSDANFEETVAAIDAGCSHATHLFNAMQGIHHRAPGTTTALLMSDQVNVELIADGVHLHPAIVNLAYKIKGSNKVILVTDAIRAKCLGNGYYDLAGLQVQVKGNEARLPNGHLAGSVLKMHDALKNMLLYTDCGYLDLVKMTAENPAKALGVYDRKGSIAVGKDADLVVLNKDHKVVLTLCRGKISHNAAKSN